MKDGYRAIHADGSAVTDVLKLPRGLSKRDPLGADPDQSLCDQVLGRILLSQACSWPGHGGEQATRRGLFKVHDRNEVLDPLPDWLLAATKEEAAGWRRSSGGPRPQGPPGTLAAWKTRLTGLLHRVAAEAAIEFDRGPRRLGPDPGWALTPHGTRVESFMVAVDRRPGALASLVRIPPERYPPALPEGRCRLRLQSSDRMPRPGRPRTPAGRRCAGAGYGDRPLRRGEVLRAAAARPSQPGGSSTCRNSRTAKPATGEAAPRVPNKPSMPPDAVARLTEALRTSSCYLEYGSGGSTVLAASLNVAPLIAVESDKEWQKLVRNRLGGDSDRRFLLHADIGPTKSLGYPVSTEHWGKFHTYPMMPWDLCRARGLAPISCLSTGNSALPVSSPRSCSHGRDVSSSSTTMPSGPSTTWPPASPRRPAWWGGWPSSGYRRRWTGTRPGRRCSGRSPTRGRLRPSRFASRRRPR